MGERLHPRLEQEIRRLGRNGVPAAEVRRRVAGLAAELRIPRPGYTLVQRLVRVERPQWLHAPDEPSALSTMLAGRAPTLRQIANAVGGSPNIPPSDGIPEA